ncbi:MAG TPA: hypothetical protein PKW90_07825, partial [Myxococcota bacterium]|nr:hypothetical protein [Myxococcota bacterium]
MSQAYAKSNAASGPHKGGKNGPIKSTQGATSGGDNVGQRGRRADNSLMQQKLGTPAPASGMDEGAETLLSDFTTFQADYADSFGRASTLVQKAHSAQDGGDIPGRQQAIAELRDEKKGILSALDWFLPGYGITFQLSTHLEENPSLAQVPAFRDGVLRVASFANIVKQQRSLLIPFLIPRTVHGKKVPEIPGIPLGDLNFSDAVEGQEQLLDPLFSAALELRRQVAGAGHLSGPAAAALATELASGPIADFEPGSGEFEYLYTVVQSSNASADVRLRLDWLLGRDDFSVYQGLYGPAMAMGSMIQTQADVAAGNPKAPARFNSPFDLGSDEDDGICYLPGMAPKKLSDIFSLKTPAVNPQDKIAPGEVADRAAGKAPGIREFDSSEMPEEEEEEEAPKTSNGKPSDRGMGKVQTTTTREGKMVVGDGKVGGEASAKRVVKQRSGAGSSVGGGASLEAGEHLSGSANIAGKRTSKDGGTIGGSAQVGRDEEGNWNGKLRLEGESLDRKGSGV